MSRLVTTEALFVKHAGIGASPLQLAMCRAADGRRLRGVLTAAELVQYFGVESEAALVGLVVVLMVIVAGVRGGKSFTASCAALKGALTADMSGMKPHEVARVPIVAPNTDNAAATFAILRGVVDGSAALAALVVGRTADSLTLRRPDGRVVEIVVAPASRGGISLRSRWLAGFVLEECAFFPSEVDGHVISAEALLRAGETRLLPGAAGWIVSSPNGPQGLLHDLYRGHFGKPDRVLVVHAPTRALNPSFPQKTIDAVRRRDPDAAAREYDAAWVDAESAFFDAATVDGATRPDFPQLPVEEETLYTAAIDPATRSNAFTLCVIATGERHRVALVRQWQGSKRAPLSPRETLRQIAAAIKPYGVHTVLADQWSVDAIKDLAADVGLEIEERVQTAASKWQAYENLRTLLLERRLELAPDPLLRSDLLALRKVVNHAGPKVEAPRQPGGRHADYASALALAACDLVDPHNDYVHADEIGPPIAIDTDRLAGRGDPGDYGGLADGGGMFGLPAAWIGTR